MYNIIVKQQNIPLIKIIMLEVKISDNKNNILTEEKGSKICIEYTGYLEEGYSISIKADGLDFISVKLDEVLAESIVYIPNKHFKFVIPSENVLRICYPPGAFRGTTHKIIVREPEDNEIYGTRNISLNPYDMKGKKGAFPHAYANFVTREEPCFYERNAIDGIINNQGHGAYPFHSWAGGARNDLEYVLDFGREVELDKIVIYLRADFKHDEITGKPHDSYWRNITFKFSDGSTLRGEFKLNNSDLDPENSKGQEIILNKKRTKNIKLLNFIQVSDVLGFAALTQIQAYGRIIKEELSKMEVRQAANAEDVKHYTTERLREEFHISSLFTKDNIRMVYSHIDRIIVAGLMPVRQVLKLEADKELASEFFLERREMGCINIGGKGIITIDGKEYEMNPRDGIYIGKGNKNITFKSCDENAPAKFYIASSPAHTEYPTVKIDIEKARKVPCGSFDGCNKRVINQYIHPDVMKSCQLSMGLTRLESGSNWNTMPCHTHDRRMEVYLYLDMGEDDVVFHMMGEPEQTRHIIMHNEEAVISPSWSIHSGVGTKNYSFIWAMCGENQEFTDMDHIENKDLL